MRPCTWCTTMDGTRGMDACCEHVVCMLHGCRKHVCGWLEDVTYVDTYMHVVSLLCGCFDVFIME